MSQSSQTPPQPPPGAPPQPPPESPPALPRELEIKFNGDKVKYDLANAQQLELLQRHAQMGRLYESKQQALTAKQQELASKERFLKAGETLEQFRTANPSGARAVGSIVQALQEGRVTPEQVLAALGGQPQSQPDPAEAPTSAPSDPHTRAVLDQLAARQQALDSELAGLKQSSLQKDRLSEIERALAQDEFLRTRPKARELVQGQILAHLQQGRSLDEALLIESTRVRELIGEEATAERDQRLEAQELRSPSPSLGLPVSKAFGSIDRSKIPANVSGQARTREMLKSVKEKALEYARSVANGAVRGPQH